MYKCDKKLFKKELRNIYITNVKSRIQENE
jgi:hypothetical protein